MTTRNCWNDPEFDLMFQQNMRYMAEMERPWTYKDDLDVLQGNFLLVEPIPNPRRYAQDDLGHILERKRLEKQKSKARRSYGRNRR